MDTARPCNENNIKIQEKQSAPVVFKKDEETSPTQMATVPSCTFLKTLNSVVLKKKDKVFATWYGKKGNATDSYTFQKIWEEVGLIARDLLLESGLAKGDRGILCYSFGLKFFAVFLGCIRAGVVAVLIYPPSPSNISQALPKMDVIAKDCDAKVILVNSKVNKLRFLDQNNPVSRSFLIICSRSIPKSKVAERVDITMLYLRTLSIL